MFFLDPRRIPSHKVHSHGSNGSRKERRMDFFFSLLSVVLVAVLSLFHFPLFSCLLSCITPGTLFLSVLGQLPSPNQQTIITKSLVSKISILATECMRRLSFHFQCLMSLFWGSPLWGTQCDEGWGLQSMPEGPLIAAARPKDKLLSMVGQLVEYDSSDQTAVLRKPCGKGRALKRPLPVFLFRVSA